MEVYDWLIMIWEDVKINCIFPRLSDKTDLEKRLAIKDQVENIIIMKNGCMQTNIRKFL